VKKIYVLSFIMSLVVGISVYFFSESLKEDALRQNQIVKGNVVVAVRFVPADTEITPDMVQMADLPVEAINPLATRKLDEVIGAITQYPLEAQEQVLSTRVQKRGEAAEGRLSYVLETGQRAITLPVDELTGVAGYISKGDYVDLLVNMLKAEYNEEFDVSSFVVQDVLVLEVGKKKLSSTEATDQGYASVTLSVSPEDAVVINYAAKSGIRMILRPVLDHETTEETYYPTVFPTQATGE